ncbi:MAG: hypothetical protein PWQ55_2401 [Chloroflexota bacterium]|nr:hypothetical protein [Chloroflexota bacterium]
MSVQFSSFIGVEVCADRSHPFTFVVIDTERVIRSLGSGELTDAFAFLAGQENALVAINAPLPFRKSSEVEQESPRRRKRGAEEELARRGVNFEHTPTSMKRCPRWMRLGFRLYDELEKLGYARFPQPDAARQLFQCQGEACFWSLLGHEPLKKDSLEGRLQRQLVLGECGLPVPDGMRFFEGITRHRILHNRLPLEEIYSSAELNALAAAYCAWLGGTRPQRLEHVGGEDEYPFYLPAQPVISAMRD